MPAKSSRYAQSREALKQETRQALLKAAANLFSRKGIDVSLDEICAEAGFTRGAFYVHFKNREDLLAQVVDRAGSGVLDQLLGPEDQTASDDLPVVAMRFVQALLQGNLPASRLGGIRFHQFLNACVRFPEIRQQYQANMQRARDRVTRMLSQLQQQGSLRADVDAAALAAVIMTLVEGAQIFDDVEVDMPFEAGARVLLQLLMPVAAPANAPTPAATSPDSAKTASGKTPRRGRTKGST